MNHQIAARRGHADAGGLESASLPALKSSRRARARHHLRAAEGQPRRPARVAPVGVRAGWAAAEALQAVSLASLMALVWGTVLLLTARSRSLPAPLRFAVAPMRLTALLYALSLTAWALSVWLVPEAATAMGAISVLT